MDKMVKKWGREGFYLSCNYSCTISSECLNLNHDKSETSKQKFEGWKDEGICQNFRPLPSQV